MTTSKHHELFILRHAKSDWDSDTASDFERPLAKRGEKDAPTMGKWMAKQNFTFDYILSSPAKRAKQTVYAVAKELGIAKKGIQFNDKVYLASVEILLKLLGACPKNAKKVMIVGHNPGLDDLLQFLVKDPPLTESGKLFTTACLAHISFSKDWSHLQKHCGKLISITRPRDIA